RQVDRDERDHEGEAQGLEAFVLLELLAAELPAVAWRQLHDAGGFGAARRCRRKEAFDLTDDFAGEHAGDRVAANRDAARVVATADLRSDDLRLETPELLQRHASP